MTKVLILGAHGQIARVATRLLLDRTDTTLTLYLRKAKRLSSLEGNGRVRLAEGDIVEAAALDAVMPEQDVVYANLSGDMERQARVSIAAMDRAGVCRLIFISSVGTYDEVPGERYGAVLGSYRRSVAVIEASGLEYTIIWPAWLSNDAAIFYRTKAKGEAFANPAAYVSRMSVAGLIVRLVAAPASGKASVSTRHRCGLPEDRDHQALQGRAW